MGAAALLDHRPLAGRTARAGRGARCAGHARRPHLAPSHQRPGRTLRAVDDRALVLRRAQRRRPDRGAARPATPPRPLRESFAGRHRHPGAAVPRAPGLDRATARGQSARSTRRHWAERAVLPDGTPLPQGPGDVPPGGTQAHERGRGARARPARAPRGAQLRARSCLGAVAPGLPPRRASRAHPRGHLGEALPAGHPGRPLAPGLPPAVVPGRERAEPGPWSVPGLHEAWAAACADDRQRRGHARRRDGIGSEPPGGAAPDDAAVLALPERQAGVVLGARRGAADAHARGRAGAHTGTAQPGDPGLGRAGISPYRAQRDRRHAARALSGRPQRAPRLSRPHGARRRVPHRGTTAPAACRRHRDPARAALRDPVALPRDGRGAPALRALGPDPGRSRRSALRRRAVPDHPARQVRQRRARAPAAVDLSPLPPAGMAPLLTHLLADYATTGLPPAYLPAPHSNASTAEQDLA